MVDLKFHFKTSDDMLKAVLYFWTPYYVYLIRQLMRVEMEWEETKIVKIGGKLKRGNYIERYILTNVPTILSCHCALHYYCINDIKEAKRRLKYHYFNFITSNAVFECRKLCCKRFKWFIEICRSFTDVIWNILSSSFF